MNARCEPKPLQKPHPPLMIGGGGEKKTLRVVAKHADMWNWFGTVESIKAKIGILRDHCAAVGRNLDEIELTWCGDFRVVSSRAEKTAALDQMAKHKSQPPAEVDANCLVGESSEIADRIREYESVGVGHMILSASPPFDHAGLSKFADQVIPRFR